MKKSKVLDIDKQETILLEEDGWKIVFIASHFNGRYWYEIMTPNDEYLDFMTKDIFEAIDTLNTAKNKNI